MEQPGDDSPNTHLLKRGNNDNATTRRSTRACHRCRTKKLKCYHAGPPRNKCVSCTRAKTDCVYDQTPDGIPRGSEYVTSLERRIASLESELRTAGLGQPSISDSSAQSHGNAAAVDAVSSGKNMYASHSASVVHAYSFPALIDNALRSPIANSMSPVTDYSLLQGSPTASAVHINTLPPLPSDQVAHTLVERVYLYTQARYCIVDWVRVREWHRERETLCYDSTEAQTERQIGAYFVWIIYAIGAGLISNPEHPPKAYFARAREYLHAVLARQDLTSVQGLLCLLQYMFRAEEASVWHLVGTTMRLCIELDCHRKAKDPARRGDPYTLELKKRFFWCIYCFDRIICSVSKRPFGIHDSDIDAEPPVNVDVTCTDVEKIRDLQARQLEGEEQSDMGNITTISATLHHLKMYRLKSRIISRLLIPRASAPTYVEVTEFLIGMDTWRATAPRNYPPGYPRQMDEHVQAMYYQTTLLVMRPVLLLPIVPPDLLARCAKDAAEACENAKVLNLSHQSAPSLTGLHQTFVCGVTLLRCLAIQRTVLTPDRTVRAIIACSSTLAVYTRMFAAAAPFRELFEQLSDEFLPRRHDDQSTSDEGHLVALRLLLDKALSSDPSHIPALLRSFTQDKVQVLEQSDQWSGQVAIEMDQDFPSTFEMGDLNMPFETAFDIFPQDGPHQDLMSFWAEL